MTRSALFNFLTVFEVSADLLVVTASDELVDREIVLNRFRRLIGDLLKGTLSRNSFQPWEVEILLDLEGCPIHPKRRPRLLRQYEKAVVKEIENGTAILPVTLSCYLESARMTRRPKT